MFYHIVRMNETIEKIALTYNLDVVEIKNINQHIRKWDNLVAGTKLNLPTIPEGVKDDLNDVEPFIEDYYPKLLNLNDSNLVEEDVMKTDVIISQNKENNNEPIGQSPQKKDIVKPIKEVKNNNSSIYYNGYNPFYPPYYPYYPPYNLRKKKIKKI